MINPAIRFKAEFGCEFSDWKSFKFSDCFKFLATKPITRSNLNYEKGSIRCIHYGDVLVKYGDVLRTSKYDIPFITSDSVEKCDFLKNGDVVIADTAEDYSAGKVTEIAMLDDERLISGLHTIACRPLFDSAPGFLGHYLNSPSFHNSLIPLLTGTKVYSISKSELKKSTVNIPCIDEQQKIASFFSTLDEKISLAEQKLEAFEKLKKGSMQKLLTKEVRFKDSNGEYYSDWVKMPLSSLMTFQNGINTSRGNFGDGIKLISVNDILSRNPIAYHSITTSVSIDEKAKEKFCVSYGDILFQRSSETVEDAGSCNVYLDKEKNAVFGGFVIRGKKKADYDPIFLNEILRSHSVRKAIIRLAQGAQHINIGQDSLSQISVDMPCLEEQRKISNLIVTFNKKIDLIEEQLKQLKLLKKALMQQMFI